MSSPDGDGKTKPRSGGLFGALFGGGRGGETATGGAETPAEAQMAVDVGPDVDGSADVAVGTSREAGVAAAEEASAASGPEARDVAILSHETDTDGGKADAAGGQAGEEAGGGDGWFARLRSGLSKTSSRLSEGITGLFTKAKIDPETLEDFEDLLIQADLGVTTATRITDILSKSRVTKGLSPDEVRAVLIAEVEKVLRPVARPLQIIAGRKPHVILMVGVNGTGKTTTIGKLAATYRDHGLHVMMAAGDTFRAAAIDQLKVWGERTGAEVIAREVGADSSGLAFDALKRAKDAGCDVLLIDTAGRLQNKQALMEELEKVIRVIKKVDADAPHDTVLVLDATTGQNALQQVEVFRERAGVSGLVMTKLDGTARGGIIVAIAERYGLPVHAIGVGEGLEDLQPFDPGEFAKAIAAT